MSINPEQAVIDAINGLEDDEIGELVRWQLEEGIRRGEFPAPSEDPWAIRMDTSRFTAEFERLGFRLPSREEIDAFRARLGTLRETLRYHLPADAPYQDMPEIRRGDRIGWQDTDGVVLYGVVQEHVEDPPGSGHWTTTIGDFPDSSSSL